MLQNYLLALVDWWRVNVLLIENRKNIYFKERQIWWCSIGMNIGEEEFGKGRVFERPVLIFKKFTKSSFLGLPFTGHNKEGSWYVPNAINGRKSSIMLNQARVLDGKRLRRKIVEMNEDDFEIVRSKFRELYCPQELIIPSPTGATGIDGKSQIVP